MKAVVFTLGCKVNQYESQALINMLLDLGYEASGTLSYADLYVINTCSVTAEADKKSRQAISRALRFNPNAKVVVVGCSSQNNAKPYLSRPNVITVAGTAGKLNALKKALAAPSEKQSPAAEPLDLPKSYEDYGKLLHTDKTRAVIKIQDGCNRFCSYCVIPYLRGRSRSRALDDIVFEAKQLAESTKEIVLTGIDTSSYGADIGLNLTALVRALGAIDCRKRLGSLECLVIDDNLLNAMKDSGFCAHFHLSLQSGSDSVLRRMNRRYTSADYLKKVELIRKYFPLAGITTDIITGFCLETDLEHRQTAEFISAAQFSDVHVFPFSARKGTKAYLMPAVEELIKAKRTKELCLIKEQLRLNFLQKNLAKTAVVYVEQQGENFNFGYTENYIKVHTAAPVNSLLKHSLIKIYKDGMLGTVD